MPCCPHISAESIQGFNWRSALGVLARWMERNKLRREKRVRLSLAVACLLEFPKDSEAPGLAERMCGPVAPAYFATFSPSPSGGPSLDTMHPLPGSTAPSPLSFIGTVPHSGLAHSSRTLPRCWTDVSRPISPPWNSTQAILPSPNQAPTPWCGPGKTWSHPLMEEEHGCEKIRERNNQRRERTKMEKKEGKSAFNALNFHTNFHLSAGGNIGNLLFPSPLT